MVLARVGGLARARMIFGGEAMGWSRGGTRARGRVLRLIGGAVLTAMVAAAPALAQTIPPNCANPARALGVERVIEIDTATGAHFGEHTRQPKEPSFLKPKEVVLTFDDGPLPGVTKPILDTLDAYCTRATFFAIGKMAMAFPGMVRETIRRGHTMAGHTWSHPLNVPRLKSEAAQRLEIDKGFAAISLAAGEPIAPFFRFPGLNDSRELLAYLQTRGIATFTVDVISNDSYIGSADSLVQRTLSLVEQRQGGILLFHDIKAVTARALPAILAGLKSRGYKVVHLRAKKPVETAPELMAELAPVLAKSEAKSPTPPIGHVAALPGATVDTLAPAAKDFLVASLDKPASALRTRSKAVQRAVEPARGSAAGGSWATTYRRTPRKVSSAE